MTKCKLAQPQNIIAIAADFDLTLISEYCQGPLFRAYDMDGYEFWQGVDQLAAKLTEINRDESQFSENLQVKSDETGISTQHGAGICRETFYLDVLFDNIRSGQIDQEKGGKLNRQRLRELGQDLAFFPGVPNFVKELKDYVSNNEEWNKYDIKLEFYVISTGIAEIIRGSKLGELCDGVFACEVYENAQGVIDGTLFPVTHTEKTRFVYKIHKGFGVDVNDQIPKEQRRIDGRNIMVIGDGPSDIPMMATAQDIGGMGLGVYSTMAGEAKNKKYYNNAHLLRQQGRVFNIAPADYNKGSAVRMTLERFVDDSAQRIIEKRDSMFDRVNKIKHI